MHIIVKGTVDIKETLVVFQFLVFNIDTFFGGHNHGP